jgi:hypothetical protein
MTKEEQKSKLQESLLFENSILWDGVMFVIDETIAAELNSAVSQGLDEQKRQHQCGRADGLMYLKDLLESTREEALKISGRK